MKTIKNIVLTSALLSITTFASADQNNDFNYAPVVDVQPIYETVQVPQNRRVCRKSRHNNRNRNNSRHQQGNSSGGAILGGIIGGLLGNRFGDGRGRDAATAVGIMTGAAIGSQASSSNNRYGNSRNRRGDRCKTVRDYYEEERIMGYNVSYDYNGRIYHTRMHNHPGERVRINVTVQVADY